MAIQKIPERPLRKDDRQRWVELGRSRENNLRRHETDRAVSVFAVAPSARDLPLLA